MARKNRFKYKHDRQGAALGIIGAFALMLLIYSLPAYEEQQEAQRCIMCHYQPAPPVIKNLAQYKKEMKRQSAEDRRLLSELAEVAR